MPMPKSKPPVRESTVADAWESFKSTTEELQEEMSSWRDAIEEKFSATEKYERISETSDILENVFSSADSADVDALPEALASKTVSYPGLLKAKSRAARLAEATNAGRAALEAVQDWKDAADEYLSDKEDSDESDKDVEWTEENVSAADNFLTYAEDALSEAESIEFPGMFG